MEKLRQKKNVQANQSNTHVQENNSNKSISRFMLTRKIENELFYEILELDIPTSKKDSICDKLCMLLDWI